MYDKFYNHWMSNHVCVIAGPLKDREGHVCGVGEITHKVLVAFPESVKGGDQLWFHSRDVELVKGKCDEG